MSRCVVVLGGVVSALSRVQVLLHHQYIKTWSSGCGVMGTLEAQKLMVHILKPVTDETLMYQHAAP